MSTSKSTVEKVEDNAHFWKYVEKIEKLETGRRNWQWKCSYCHEHLKGSNSRVKAHLLRTGTEIKMCSAVKPHHLNDMKKVMEQAEFRVKASMSRPIGLLTSSSFISLRLKKRRGNTVDASFNMGATEELNAITRMIYSNGLSFNFTRNLYYAMTFTYVANKPISDYIPLGYNFLMITLLQNEKPNIERKLEPSIRRGCLFVVMDGRMHKGDRSLIS